MPAFEEGLRLKDVPIKAVVPTAYYTMEYAEKCLHAMQERSYQHCREGGGWNIYDLATYALFQGKTTF